MFSKFRERGLSVIPLRGGKKGKAPLDDFWSKWCLELPTEAECEEWDFKYKRYGLCCGPASGVMAIDIDTDDRSIIDACKLSPLSKRGRQGETRLFKYNPDIHSQDLGDVVNVLCVGRQTVIPPTTHPLTNKPYFWLTPDTLENFDVKDLPEFTLDDLNRLKAKVLSTTVEYLDELENTGIDLKGGPWINQDPTRGSPTGSQSRLKRIVTAMIGRGAPPEECARELLRFDRENHKPVPYFEDETRSDCKGNPVVSALSFYTSNLLSFSRRCPKGTMPTPLIPGAELISIDITDQPKKSDKFAFKSYPAPRGIMKKFVEYCELTSAGKQDALALGGAIALMGGLCSNRFNTRVRGLTTTPNVYVMNLAHSSFGKEAAQKVLHDLLIESEVSNLLGSASYRSSSSIVMGLPKQQERVDLIDECSSLLRAMGGKEDYKAEIVEILSLLYSKASSKFMGYTSLERGEKYGATWNPCVNILGSTTPAGFRSSVNKDMASKGLLPRFFLFTQAELGKYKGRQTRQGAEDLYRDLQDFIDRMLSIPKREHPDFNPQRNLLARHKRGEDSQDVSQGIRYLPDMVPFTDEAHEAWLNFDEECHDQKAVNPEGFESAFIGRFAEKTAKLALLDAISLSQKEITMENFLWAKQVIEAEWHNAMPLYELASAENRTESFYLRVLKVIQEHGILAKSELIRLTRYMGPSERDLILKQMVEQNLIEIGKHPNWKKRGPAPVLVKILLQELQE